MAWLSRLAAVLAHPRFGWAAALVGVLLALPALGAGLQLDDHLHRFYVGLHTRGEGLGVWWDLYVAAEGDEALTRARMDMGFSPWWTVPDLRLRFFRPVAAATHYVDYALWPDAAWLMHAQNLAWYGGLVVAVGALMRRLLGPTWVAGLATLLFAIDDAHGTPIGWIAQRNALICGVLTVLVLLIHDRTRRDGWSRGAIVGPFVFLAALLAGEAAVAALGYLGAHALLLEPAARRDQGGHPLARAGRAVAALWPYVVVLVAWRITYDWLGYGAHGSGVYLDPSREPWAFLAVLPDRAAALGLAQLGWPDADAWTLVPTPWAPARRRALALGLAVVVAVLPRLRRDRGLAVCLVGAALALVPASAAVASNRMLLMVGVGGSAVVAGVIAAALAQGEPHPPRWWTRALPVVLSLPLLVVHAGLAPLAVPGKVAALPRELEDLQRVGVESLPDDPALTRQDLMVVNSPPTFVGAYMWLMRWDSERALPKRMRVLGSTFAPVIVQRPDPNTLVLQPVGGYFGDPFSAIVRGRAHPFSVGDRIELDGWTVEIQAVMQGRPTSVLMRLDTPLEDPSLRWVTWRGDRFEPFVLPAVGKVSAIPGRPPVTSLR